jgi:hypothetical protein
MADAENGKSFSNVESDRLPELHDAARSSRPRWGIVFARHPRTPESAVRRAVPPDFRISCAGAAPLDRRHALVASMA